MSVGLTLVAIKQDDVAGLGLGLAQLKAQAHARDLAGDLATFQGVPRPPPAEVFFRSVLDNCDLPIRTPLRASISLIRRAIVQLRRLATGASKRGVTTRSAASLFTGAGPGATLAFSASTPPSAKSRHGEPCPRVRRKPAMRGLVQPKSVRDVARRPIRLATVARLRERSQRRTLLPIRRYWRFAHHAPPPRINTKTESHLPFVGYTRGICLGRRGTLSSR